MAAIYTLTKVLRAPHALRGVRVVVCMLVCYSGHSH